MNKKKQHSQNLQIQQTQDILEILYLTLNYPTIFFSLYGHLESSESRESEKGKSAYSLIQKLGYHLVENYRKKHSLILQRDSQATFISRRIEEKIQKILDTGERDLEKLLQKLSVEILPN